MTDSVQSVPAPPPTGWLRWMPGLNTLRHYPRRWLAKDVGAGLVLSAVLVPVGMGYAEAAGVPAIHGLYATVLPLLAYALLGPSRIMVLGPDSTLAAVIASLILPLAAGSVERAVTLAGALALLSGAFLLLIGFARLGVMADLFSKPIRLGFFNAIALTVIIGQMPKLLGFSAPADGPLERLSVMAHGIAAGKAQPVALAIGLASLAVIVALKRWRPRWPGVLVAVAGATVVSAVLDLSQTAHLAVLGPLPQGMPAPSLPLLALSLDDLRALVPGAAIIALLSFADTSVLSRALAARSHARVNPNQEMLALGVANLAAGLFQGFPISSSASRTPVAEAAGARSQVTSLVGAAVIVLLLVAAPRLLAAMPSAVLGAVVISACLSFADWPSMIALLRQRPVEFVLAVVSFLGVAFFGVIEGIVVAIGLSLGVLVWNAWHPYCTVLVRVDGRKGYHDASRHPEGRHVPGLVIFRWDAQLFFANADLFREDALEALRAAPDAPSWLLIAADALNDIDVTSAEVLAELDRELEGRGIQLHFAGLKGKVRDLVMRYGLSERFDAGHFHSTTGSGVNAYRQAYPVNWKDWDER